jgi:hypothetical protein
VSSAADTGVAVTASGDEEARALVARAIRELGARRVSRELNVSRDAVHAFAGGFKNSKSTLFAIRARAHQLRPLLDEGQP